ncbi:hypothetical protein [Pantoea phage Nafs113]|nr:hypothetical protein [Pantoea phage Nafs113]
MSDNITAAIRAIIEASPHLDDENKKQAISHFDWLVAQADKIKNREMVMTINIDRSSIDEMAAEVEKMKGVLIDTIMKTARDKGMIKAPEGSEWIPIDRVSELSPREGVIVTDGEIWGLSKYNPHRKNPFPVIYDVCEWGFMGDITHFRRMNAIQLPDGKIMEQPKTAILKRNTISSPCCKSPLLWHQIQGMRLVEIIEGTECYGARCYKCHQHHWVRK